MTAGQALEHGPIRSSQLCTSSSWHEYNRYLHRIEDEWIGSHPISGSEVVALVRYLRTAFGLFRITMDTQGV